MILSGVAWRANWTDKLLYYIHNKKSHPWLVNDWYKMCYSMPNHCYNSKTSKEYGLNKVHAPNILSNMFTVYCDSSYP